MQLNTLRAIISVFPQDEPWRFSIQQHPNWFTTNAFDLHFECERGFIVINVDLDDNDNPPLVRGYSPKLEEIVRTLREHLRRQDSSSKASDNDSHHQGA
jgi:hypothetical protein